MRNMRFMHRVVLMHRRFLMSLAGAVAARCCGDAEWRSGFWQLSMATFVGEQAARQVVEIFSLICQLAWSAAKRLTVIRQRVG